MLPRHAEGARRGRNAEFNIILDDDNCVRAWFTTGAETINRLPLDSLRRNTFQRFRSMDIIDHPMPVNVIRSKKRAKTVQARIVGDTIEIVAPAQLSDTELQPLIAPLVARLERQRQKQHLNDEELARIATSLNQQYFNNGLTWNSLTWSTQQHKRFGSCTPALKTIRISHRLITMPRFVLEYVIMHELAHLREANHGPRFWQLVNRYPRTERARGYLMAVGLEDLNDAPTNATHASDVE